MLIPLQREVVIEVPRDLVHSSQSESTHEKAIAIGLARRAALMTFPTVAERVVGPESCVDNKKWRVLPKSASHRLLAKDMRT
jgi:hypothetical protein